MSDAIPLRRNKATWLAEEACRNYAVRVDREEEAKRAAQREAEFKALPVRQSYKSRCREG